MIKYKDINGKTATHSLRGTSGVLYGRVNTMSVDDITAMLADGITEVVPAAKIPPSAHKIETKRIKAISGTCRAKIFEQYSDSDQRNGSAEAIDLLLTRMDNGFWTVEEATRAAELKAAGDWIKSMVLFCRAKIVDGTTTVGDLEYVDMEAEPDEDGKYPTVSLWPAPPVSEVTP